MGWLLLSALISLTSANLMTEPRILDHPWTAYPMPDHDWCNSTITAQFGLPNPQVGDECILTDHRVWNASCQLVQNVLTCVADEARVCDWPVDDPRYEPPNPIPAPAQPPNLFFWTKEDYPKLSNETLETSPINNTDPDLGWVTGMYRNRFQPFAYIIFPVFLWCGCGIVGLVTCIFGVPHQEEADANEYCHPSKIGFKVWYFSLYLGAFICACIAVTGKLEHLANDHNGDNVYQGWADMHGALSVIFAGARDGFNRFFGTYFANTVGEGLPGGYGFFSPHFTKPLDAANGLNLTTTHPDTKTYTINGVEFPCTVCQRLNPLFAAASAEAHATAEPMVTFNQRRFNIKLNHVFFNKLLKTQDYAFSCNVLSLNRVKNETMANAEAFNATWQSFAGLLNLASIFGILLYIAGVGLAIAGIKYALMAYQCVLCLFFGSLVPLMVVFGLFNSIVGGFCRWAITPEFAHARGEFYQTDKALGLDSKPSARRLQAVGVDFSGNYAEALEAENPFLNWDNMNQYIPDSVTRGVHTSSNGQQSGNTGARRRLQAAAAPAQKRGDRERAMSMFFDGCYTATQSGQTLGGMSMMGQNPPTKYDSSTPQMWYLANNPPVNVANDYNVTAGFHWPLWEALASQFNEAVDMTPQVVQNANNADKASYTSQMQAVQAHYKEKYDNMTALLGNSATPMTSRWFYDLSSGFPEAAQWHVGNVTANFTKSFACDHSARYAYKKIERNFCGPVWDYTHNSWWSLFPMFMFTMLIMNSTAWLISSTDEDGQQKMEVEIVPVNPVE